MIDKRDEGAPPPFEEFQELRQEYLNRFIQLQSEGHNLKDILGSMITVCGEVIGDTDIALLEPSMKLLGSCAIAADMLKGLKPAFNDKSVE